MNTSTPTGSLDNLRRICEGVYSKIIEKSVYREVRNECDEKAFNMLRQFMSDIRERNPSGYKEGVVLEQHLHKKCVGVALKDMPFNRKPTADCWFGRISSSPSDRFKVICYLLALLTDSPEAVLLAAELDTSNRFLEECARLVHTMQEASNDQRAQIDTALVEWREANNGFVTACQHYVDAGGDVFQVIPRHIMQDVLDKMSPDAANKLANVWLTAKNEGPKFTARSGKLAEALIWISPRQLVELQRGESHIKAEKEGEIELKVMRPPRRYYYEPNCTQSLWRNTEYGLNSAPEYQRYHWSPVLSYFCDDKSDLAVIPLGDWMNTTNSGCSNHNAGSECGIVVFSDAPCAVLLDYCPRPFSSTERNDRCRVLYLWEGADPDSFREKHLTSHDALLS